MNLKPRIIARLQEAWRSRAEPESMRVVTVAYWDFLVLLGTVATIGIIAFAVQELSLVAQAQNPPPTERVGSGPELDRMQLEATLAQYVSRWAQYRSIASSTPAAIPDPSK